MYYPWYCLIVTTWPQGCKRTSLGLSRQTVHLVPVLSPCPARAALSSCLSWALSSWALPAVSQAKTTSRAEMSITNNSSNLLKTPGLWLDLTVLAAALLAPLESAISICQQSLFLFPEQIFHIQLLPLPPTKKAIRPSQSVSVKQVLRSRQHESLWYVFTCTPGKSYSIFIYYTVLYSRTSECILRILILLKQNETIS